MTSLQKKALKRSLLVFVICFVTLILLLDFYFIIQYAEEFPGKNIPPGVIMEFVFYSSLTFADKAFLFGGMIAIAAYFHASCIPQADMQLIKSSLISVFTFAIICFLLKAFFTPMVFLNTYAILYDIRHKRADRPMQYSDRAIFKDAFPMNNYYELHTTLNSLYKEKTGYENAGDTFREGYAKHIIYEVRMKMANMFGVLPVALVLYYIAMFMGRFLHKSPVGSLIAMIVFLIIPAHYFSSNFISSSVFQRILTPAQGEMMSCLLLLIILVFFYILYRKDVRKELLKNEINK